MSAAEINALMHECGELLYRHCLESEAAGLVKRKERQAGSATMARNGEQRGCARLIITTEQSPN
jgi:hypothetical protein